MVQIDNSINECKILQFYTIKKRRCLYLVATDGNIQDIENNTRSLFGDCGGFS